MQSCDHKGRNITDGLCRCESRLKKLKRDIFLLFFIFFIFSLLIYDPVCGKLMFENHCKFGREHCHWKPVTSRTRPVCVMDVYYVKSQTFSSPSAPPPPPPPMGAHRGVVFAEVLRKQQQKTHLSQKWLLAF